MVASDTMSDEQQLSAAEDRVVWEAEMHAAEHARTLPPEEEMDNRPPDIWWGDPDHRLCYWYTRQDGQWHWRALDGDGKVRARGDGRP